MATTLPFTNALIVAPHTDDAELSCGGVIARLVEENVAVTCLTLSIAYVINGEHKNTPLQECEESLTKLGVKRECQLQRLHEVRRFSEVRQEILNELIEVRDQVKPDVVFMPSSMDIHQDHIVVSQECKRAFKHITQLGYEQPWNNNTFQTNFFVPLDERHLNLKIEALSCYKSQIGRNFFSEEFLKALARVRGVQIRREYAESFEVVRWIL